jgi:hypothetical protein
MGNQVVILDLPYKLDLSSYEYPMSAAFGTIFSIAGQLQLPKYSADRMRERLRMPA